ncbi:MAG: hypothetical protein IPN84_16345 [Sphingomonadales bacterium]|nr:hypothetical protein [Sphingomonadales bacterium]
MKLKPVAKSGIALLLTGFALASCSQCNSCTEYPPYTRKLLDLAIPATKGDIEAADAAEWECSARAKIDDFNTRYDNLGVCAPFGYLRIENALASADPVSIRNAVGQIENGGAPGFADRIDLYKGMARPIVREACASAQPPKGCADKEAVAWLDDPAPVVPVTRDGPQFR